MKRLGLGLMTAGAVVFVAGVASDSSAVQLAEATLEVVPASGPPGFHFTVTVEGCDPGEQLLFDLPATPASDEGVCSETGEAVGSLTAPNAPGTYTGTVTHLEPATTTTATTTSTSSTTTLTPTTTSTSSTTTLTPTTTSTSSTTTLTPTTTSTSSTTTLTPTTTSTTTTTSPPGSEPPDGSEPPVDSEPDGLLFVAAAPIPTLEFEVTVVAPTTTVATSTPVAGGAPTTMAPTTVATGGLPATGDGHSSISTIVAVVLMALGGAMLLSARLRARPADPEAPEAGV